MCGILVCLKGCEGEISNQNILERRGPDGLHTFLSPRGSLVTSLSASVLSMQEKLTLQPLFNENYVLCFNGEIYDIDHPESDTEFLFHRLCELSTTLQRIQFLSSLEGEWSLCFYSIKEQHLLFGRDPFGRRSLLVAQHAQSQQLCCVSSVQLMSQQKWLWRELPVSSMFSVQANRVLLLQSEPRFLCRISRQLCSQEGLTRERVLFALDCAVAKRIPFNQEIAVLFSGGIDSVLIAACVHRTLNPKSIVHLVNVSFQGESAPDRLAAREALAELKAVFPLRNFHLKCVNVCLDDVKQAEVEIVSHMAPKQTVMDFNLSCVLWFGAQHAPVCALLSGIGADELCGGYSRHRQMDSLNSLHEEMMMDLNRLWDRNFGRDDRIVSAWGKELRIPFMDSQVLTECQHAPLEEIAGKRGGEKRVLREIMHSLHLPDSAQRGKRAAQFGSRMAKLIRPDVTGSDVFCVGTTLL